MKKIQDNISQENDLSIILNEVFENANFCWETGTLYELMINK